MDGNNPMAHVLGHILMTMINEIVIAIMVWISIDIHKNYDMYDSCMIYNVVGHLAIGNVPYCKG